VCVCVCVCVCVWEGRPSTGFTYYEFIDDLSSF
jgi:hypothetical protein